jgi:hypothetical protein
MPVGPSFEFGPSFEKLSPLKKLPRLQFSVLCNLP